MAMYATYINTNEKELHSKMKMNNIRLHSSGSRGDEFDWIIACSVTKLAAKIGITSTSGFQMWHTLPSLIYSVTKCIANTRINTCN